MDVCGRRPAVLRADALGCAEVPRASRTAVSASAAADATEPAEVADVRNLDLSPRVFRTRVAGLFLMVPLMRNLDLGQVGVYSQNHPNSG